MKSRWMVAVLFVLSGLALPGTAQDQTEQRISGLETRVAALETTVANHPEGIAPVEASPFASPIAIPLASPVAGADALWSGTYVDHLPTCNGSDVCLAALNQSERVDEYYYGVIQNNMANTVHVRKVAITLRDATGGVAAGGDSVNIAPPFIAPGGRAIVLLTIAGQRDPSFTSEAAFDYQANATPSGYGTPIRVDNASFRGDAIVGELTNTSVESFTRFDATTICFGDNGAVTHWATADASAGPYATGDSDTFSIAIYGGADFSNFVVVGTGSPYPN